MSDAGPREGESGAYQQPLTFLGRQIVRLFSPLGLSRRPAIVFYSLWEFGAKVATLAFNLSNPLLVNSLGDLAFGDGTGAILYSYLSVAISITTALSFLTFTSVMEYNLLRRKAMVRFGYVCSVGLLLFVFCFTPGSVYLASLLSVVCKVSQSIASLANDALLDSVANEESRLIGAASSSSSSSSSQNAALPPSSLQEPLQEARVGDYVNVHAINSRAYVTGYCGMILFLVCLVPVLAIAYFPGHLSLFWVQGIIPIVLIGSWYLFFLVQVDQNLPRSLGRGLRVPTQLEARRIVDAEREASKHSLEAARSFSRSLSKLGIEPGAAAAAGAGAGQGGDEESSPTTAQASASHASLLKTSSSSSSSSSSSAIGGDGGGGGVSGYGSNEPSPPLSPSLAPRDPPTSAQLSLPQLLLFGFKRGTAMQWGTVKSLAGFPDLSKFIASWVFLSGAANTAYTVGAIIAYDINIGTQNPIYYIIAGVFLGIFSAIFGLVVFRSVLERGWAMPKQVLVFNALVIALVFVYILYIKTAADFFAVALIAGTQIGSLGSFSKSLVSKLVPTKRQSRLFSFYQFSQEATGWIGPLIVASIQAGLGGGRRAFLVSTVEVCLVEIAIGVPLLLWVDVKKGEETRAAFDSLELPLGQSSENLNE